MIKWRPYEELENFGTEVENLGMDLSVDMYETDEDVIATMNVPGIAEKDIHVRVDDKHLHISGERKDTKDIEKEHYSHREIRRGHFERTISLPCAVKESKVVTKMSHGVLTITLPKK
jgi:HSP20 family protein